MLQELKFQLSTAILTVLTIAAAIAAALNYQQIQRFRLPDDGVTWVDRTVSSVRSQVVALRVTPNGPADRAGIRVNDVLKSIQAAPIGDASDVPKRLAYVGAWAKAAYVVRRATGPESAATAEHCSPAAEGAATSERTPPSTRSPAIKCARAAGRTT